MELGGQHLGDQVGDIGFDIQLDVVVAKAVGINLLQHAGVVHDSLVVGGDVKVHLNREGDAQCGQLLDGLLFILLGFFSIQTDNLLTVELGKSQLLVHQLGVVGAVGGVGQALHGVVFVFTAQRVQWIQAAVIVGQIKAVVDGQPEGFVGRSGVPIGVGGPVLFVLVKVEADGVGADWLERNHAVVIFVVGVIQDGLDGAFIQADLVDLTGLVKLVSGIG